MKKLHTLAFYTLVTPVIALSSSALIAEPSEDTGVGHEKSSAEYDRDDKKSQHKGMSDSRNAGDHQAMRGQSQQQNRGYMSMTPANGRQASSLIGSEVTTSGNEEVGSVSDLLIDENGQVVAIVVGVGGFLGMGEKNVAIGWDDVKTSGSADEQELRIDATREELSSAPAFEEQD
ncbi:PRC-barrel domain-containing protein [Marinimicrobium sp. C2-29]|uniref:PRC-barrel domain-containing protein n=1 Tax=Marinimicrobium sp. C2-29 TaxID=3139825 RepID=UPI00313A3E29